MVDIENFDFESLLHDMASMVAKEDEVDKDVVFSDYVVLYESIDSAFVQHLHVELPNDATDHEIREAAILEVQLELLTGQICVDVSDTKDTNGNLIFPDSLKVSFNIENGSVLSLDDIEYEKGMENAQIFSDYVMPAVMEYVNFGSCSVISVTEQEE